MLNVKEVIKQIENITSKLMALSLGIELTRSSIKNGKIDAGKDDTSIAMKNIVYEEIYKKLNENKNYNIKMFDDALIQMFYTFDKNNLISHHLAFFPVPNSSLRDTQNRLEEERIKESEGYKKGWEAFSISIRIS